MDATPSPFSTAMATACVAVTAQVHIQSRMRRVRPMRREPLLARANRPISVFRLQDRNRHATMAFRMAMRLELIAVDLVHHALPATTESKTVTRRALTAVARVLLALPVMTASKTVARRALIAEARVHHVRHATMVF